MNVIFKQNQNQNYVQLIDLKPHKNAYKQIVKNLLRQKVKDVPYIKPKSKPKGNCRNESRNERPKEYTKRGFHGSSDVYDNQQLGRAKLAWQRAKRLDPRMRGLTSRLDRVDLEAAVESKMRSVGDIYFTLQYDDSVQQSSGYDIRRVLREARQEVVRDFQYRPNHRIVVLLYSQEAFREVRSRAPEWAAGLFDGKIRVPAGKPTRPSQCEKDHRSRIHPRHRP